MAIYKNIVLSPGKKSFHYSKSILRKAWGRQPTYDYSTQLVRSIIVSAAALVANFGASFILKEILSFYYLLAATLSYSVGVLVNYYLSVTWVFAHRQLESRKAEFVIFSIINAIGLAFNVLIVAGMVEIFHLNYWAALSVATIGVFFWNFLMRKKILY